MPRRFYSTNWKHKFALGKNSHPEIVESYYNPQTNTVDLIAFNATHSPITILDDKKHVNQFVGHDKKGKEIYLFVDGYTTKSYTKLNKFVYDIKKHKPYSISSDDDNLHQLTSTYIEFKTAQQKDIELQFPLKKETMQEFQDKTVELFKNIKKD